MFVVLVFGGGAVMFAWVVGRRPAGAGPHRRRTACPAERLEGSVWESVEGRVSAQRRVAWIVIGVIGGLSMLGLLVMGATLLLLFSLD